MPNKHHHDHGEMSSLTDVQKRVRALESVLEHKGYVDRDVVNQIIEHFETQVGPHIGARVVARCWTNSEFRDALLDDATAAINAQDDFPDVGHHLIAVENTRETHKIVVCTLCSCYPWDVLGLPPVWYKSAPYRSRVVIQPRAVLREFGLELAESINVKVWDSTAETRYLVIPRRPEGTEQFKEADLAKIVTRDSMIGTAELRVDVGGTR